MWRWVRPAAPRRGRCCSSGAEKKNLLSQLRKDVRRPAPSFGPLPEDDHKPAAKSKGGTGIDVPSGRTFKKGEFKMEEGGFETLGMAQPSGAPESIDFSKHSLPVYEKFSGATEVDRESTEDYILSTDSWLKYQFEEWGRREPAAVDAFVSVTALLLILRDVYLVNPGRRHMLSSSTVAASSELHLKATRAGWWQDAIRKIIFKQQVENAPYLRSLTASMLKHRLGNQHVRNMTNTFCKLCTISQPDTFKDLLRDVDMIWGSWLYLLGESLGGELSQDAFLACSHTGKALGLVFAVETLFHSRYTKATLVPKDLCEEHACNAASLMDGQNSAASRAVVEHLLQAAASEAQRARQLAQKMSWHWKRLMLCYPMCEIEAFFRLMRSYDLRIPSNDVEHAHMESSLQLRRRAELMRKRAFLLSY